MRIAACLLVAVMLSTCAISGTFAKYTTGDDSTDTARVAKFGVVVTGASNTANALFNTEYETGNVSVTSSTNEEVVAPGTEGDFTNFVITGTPEVKVTVSYVATVTLGDKWVNEAGAYYCPLKIRVNLGGTVTEFYGLQYASATAFEDAVEAHINAYSKTYAPNTDLSAKTADDLDITWTWDYEGSATYTVVDQSVVTTPDANTEYYTFVGGNYQLADTTGGWTTSTDYYTLDSVAQNDVDDTYLGDQAAAGNAATVTIAVSATVTQED